MGLFRRKKQEDRSAPYTVKLRRTSYAKLGLIAERLGENEQNTIDGIIDFALASYTPGHKSTGNGLDLASLITGEAPEGDSDLLSTIAKALLPQLLSGGVKTSNPGGTGGVLEGNSSSPDIDLQKKMRELGL